MWLSQRYVPLAAIVLALCSGALLAFALPPHSVIVLPWVAFLPLLIAARITRPLYAMGCGLLSAAACGLMLTGVRLTLPQFGNMIGAFGGLAAVLMLAAGLACWGASRLKPWTWTLFVPCAAVAAEMIGAYVFPVNVGIALYRTAGALTLASLAGIWAASFLMWLVPASLIAVGRERRAWPIFAAAAAAALVVAILPFPREHNGKSIAVAAIQAPDEFSAAEQTARVARDADIVVWPEHLLEPGNTVPAETARKHGVYIAASFSQKVPRKNPHNTACLIAPNGGIVSRFRKRHLFGRENLECSPGAPATPKPCGGVCPGIPICFDTEFTDVCRDLVRRGADILLVPNHDPEMPRFAFHHLHRAAIAFRAAENGVPVVWAESSGLSCIFDSHGRVLTSADVNEVALQLATVTPAAHKTFFTRAGDWFAYLCVVAALALAALGRRRAPVPGSWLGA